MDFTNMRPFFFGVLLLFCACGQAQKPSVFGRFSQLESRLKSGGDTLFVVNFWATWCPPCVAELPLFEELHRKYAGQKVKVLLVSMDFKSQLEKRVLPFLSERKFQSEVLLLADPDANAWIAKVNAAWDGALPATWLVKGNQYAFHQGSYKNLEELEGSLKPMLTK